MSGPIGQQFIDQAKDMLQEKLLQHPDEGVRAMATFGLDDDDAAVQAIAEELQLRAAMAQSTTLGQN